MKLDLVHYNHPVLSTKSVDVSEFDDELKEFCYALLEATEEYDGIAIASNQVGVAKRIIALSPIEPINKAICMINPEILSYSIDEEYVEEGCLSFPGLYLKIKRPVSIVVQYQMLSGKKYQIQATDLLARVLQHEIDHTNGICFYQRLPEGDQVKIEKKLEEIAQRFREKEKY